MARVSREERKKLRLTALSSIQKVWGTGETIEYLMNDFGLTRRSPDHAIKVFKQKYPNSEDIYVIQDLFKNF